MTRIRQHLWPALGSAPEEWRERIVSSVSIHSRDLALKLSRDADQEDVMNREPATPAHGLAPTEDLFDALSDALADDVAHWASGAPVDSGAAVALEVLSDVRRDAELSTSFDEAADVVALVTADRDSARAATCSSIVNALRHSAWPSA